MGFWGVGPTLVCKVLGYPGSCLWAFWESMALTVFTGFRRVGPTSALVSPRRSGPCLWGLRTGSGSCSCLRSSQGSVATPVTLEFLGKEAIAPELQGWLWGVCLDHVLSLGYQGGGLWGPQGSVAMQFLREHMSPACSLVVPCGGDWDAPMAFPRLPGTPGPCVSLGGPWGEWQLYPL